jgi:hypothetical protein
MALLKAAYAGPESVTLWIAGAVYAVLAILYASVTFTHPIKELNNTKAV